MPPQKDTISSALIDEKLKGITLQLNAEFGLLNERILSTNKILERVEGQTRKTNGTVADVIGRIEILEKGSITHSANCPQVAAIASVREDLTQAIIDRDKDLEEYHLIKKYPKVGLAIIAITCILLVFGTYLAFTSLASDIKDQIRIEIKSDIKK